MRQVKPSHFWHGIGENRIDTVCLTPIYPDGRGRAASKAGNSSPGQAD